jgi:CRP-like cAMP-binding protein
VLIYLANIAYLLMLCAFITRDVLHLRSLLVIAQSVVVYYSWRSGVPLISVWNGVFAVINLYMVGQILRERRAVVLPADLQALFDRHFSALSPPEFLRLWRLGRRETLAQQTLVAAGARPEWLYFILSGTVHVRRPGGTTMNLPAGHFVGEMSLLTGAAANADADVTGPVEVVRWLTSDLRDIRRSNPGVWTRIQSVIGRDLVEKIQRTESIAADNEEMVTRPGHASPARVPPLPETAASNAGI